MNNWIKQVKDDNNYKKYVGNESNFDKIGDFLFNYIKSNGLKNYHYFLDIGCGPLRLGKYVIPLLYKNRYHGIDSEQWLIDNGIEKELTPEIIKKKNPKLECNSNFELSLFKKKFDFILAHSIFVHASIPQVKKIIEEVKNNIKKDGIFVFNFIKGHENNKNSEWSYPKGIKYNKFWLMHLLKNAGFAYKLEEIKNPDKTFYICKYKGK
jgi:predicted TPR repeat methyltransferase